MTRRPSRPADELFPAAYGQLRALADRILRSHRPGQTLQPTALVHETYLKLLDQSSIGPSDRTRFMGIAARAMRQVLIDHARSRNAAKRGGDWQRVTIDRPDPRPGRSATDVLALDEALTRLAGLDERRARVVELRFFGGLTIDETAEVLDVSPRTVELDWKISKAWLSRALSEEETD